MHYEFNLVSHAVSADLAPSVIVWLATEVHPNW
jgi:hypothetical protein